MFTHGSLERGGLACHAGPRRATQGGTRASREAEGVRRKGGSKPLLRFPWAGTGEAGKHV